MSAYKRSCSKLNIAFTFNYKFHVYNIIVSMQFSVVRVIELAIR